LLFYVATYLVYQFSWIGRNWNIFWHLCSLFWYMQMPFLVIYAFQCALKFVVLLFQLLVYSRKENLDLWWLAVCSLSVILSTTISTYKWWSCSPCDLLTESKHLLHSHFYESSCCLIFFYCISFRFGVFICVGLSVCRCSYLCCFVNLLMFLLVFLVCLLMFLLVLFSLSVDVCIAVVLSVCWYS
jgi:hypothetical protein